MSERPLRSFVALLVTASLAVPGAATAAASPPVDGGEASIMRPAYPVLPDTAPEAEAYGVSREEAIRIAREKLAIPESLTETYVSLAEYPEGATWNIDFRTPEEVRNGVTMNVGIDAASGAVVSFSLYRERRGDELPAPPTLTRAEAAQKAEAWLERLVPDIKDELEMEPAPYLDYWGQDAAYSFRWIRNVKGYPIRGTYVNMTIDARTGDLLAYYGTRDAGISYDVPERLLEKEQAEAAYRDQVKMGLWYTYISEPYTDGGQWRLVYMPLYRYFPVMDQDGRLLNSALEPATEPIPADLELVPAGEPYRKPASPLTREQALKLAQEITGQTGEPTRAYYDEYDAGGRLLRGWEFTWEQKDEDGSVRAGISARVDADLGLIARYYQWDDVEPLKEAHAVQFSPDEAQQKAVAFIQKYRPDLAGQLAVVPSIDWGAGAQWADVKPPVHSVRFVRLHQGIPVDGTDVSVDVDAATGEICSFWINEYVPDDPLPAAAGALTPEEAMESFLTHQGLALTWYQTWQPLPSGDMERTDPILVWAPSQRMDLFAIDGLTGAPLDYLGRDLTRTSTLPTDIEGNFAQREIEILISRGIFTVVDGLFHPEKTAAVEEAAKWLVLSRGLQPYPAYDFQGRLSDAELAGNLAASPNSGYIGAALEAGIILPEDFEGGLTAESVVSRELFALWAVRAMGYSAIVRMPNRIAMPFKDQAAIGSRYANAVALLHGLGVIAGDSESSFEPQRGITRAEAAQILFHVLTQARVW